MCTKAFVFKTEYAYIYTENVNFLQVFYYLSCQFWIYYAKYDLSVETDVAQCIIWISVANDVSWFRGN
jgi:hypothetical protein